MKISWWDRFLMGIAPGWGLARVRARATSELAARSFDAAGKGRRTFGWRSSEGDANAAHGPALKSLRELSRNLRQNNGWAVRGIETIANNTVGRGIAAKPIAKKMTAKRAAEVWKQWSGTVACDVDGRLSFAGLQRLAMETIAESGEVLVLRKTPVDGVGLPIPLQLRVVEPDLLDTSKDGRLVGTDGGHVLQGIEFDGQGRRVAYWLFPKHPDGIGHSFKSARVPAADVLHVYRVERPGQARGVPWLASAIVRLSDFDDFEDAELMQKKIAACFAAFVQDLDGGGTPIGQKVQDNDELETLEPGHISYLSPGKSVTFAQPPATPSNDGFSTRTLRRIAASLGVTYEDLSGDYSKVNFSSARMGRNAHLSHVDDWRWNMLIPQLCDGVWRWVMQLAADLQILREVPLVEWSAPAPAMIDPAKEGLAFQRAVRSGSRSLAGALRERGIDIETHLAEIAETNEQLDELGIILDSDPRHTSSTGQVQKAVPPEAVPPEDVPPEDVQPEDDEGEGDAVGT